MSSECPLCGEQASKVLTVTSGRSWADAAGLPPHTFFSRYLMVHRQQTQFGDMKLYCHTERDLKEQI